MPSTVTVIGAGLSGSLLAIYLARRGFTVSVFERRPDMRTTEISAGRSINLALSARGIHALAKVGLDKLILDYAIPMRGRMIHPISGEAFFQPYGKNESEVIYSISRRELNVQLLNLAEKYPQVEITFDARCLGMNFETKRVIIQYGMAPPTEVAAQTVIGTDGSASAIRTEMLRQPRFNFSQEYLAHGYKELSIPADAKGEHPLEKNALHIWPRKNYMMIALPNLDGTFTCTLFLAFESSGADIGFDKLTDKAAVMAFFEENFPDAVPLMPDLTDEFFRNPTGTLLTVKCAPWNVKGSALLLGDAAHAIVPFYGQGMNCSFEDVELFDTLIEQESAAAANGVDWERIYTHFSRLRKADADAIADLAIENFIEMRDLTADPIFQRKRKLELLLETAYPDKFLSKYGMVTFFRIPYAQALERGRIQDQILMEICRDTDIEAIELPKVMDQLAHALV